MGVFNPWSTRKVAATDTPSTPIADTPDYPDMDHGSFAVPSLESGSPYNDEFGWSNIGLRPSAVEYPSAQRLMTIPRHDRRPDAVRPPQEWYEPLDADDKLRHSVEYVDADGWTEDKGITAGDKRWTDNPRRTPPPETRPTEQMAPRSYLFDRPFGQDFERSLTGNHFSMADHRRDYEFNATGMEPVHSRRNTYRLEPPAWDSNIVDMPADNYPVYARNVGQQIASQARTWRLT